MSEAGTIDDAACPVVRTVAVRGCLGFVAPSSVAAPAVHAMVGTILQS